MQGTGSLLNTGATHRWWNRKSANMLAMCTKPREIKARSDTYKGQKFQSVKVKGVMTAKNILSACQAKGLIRVCDHNSYADDSCWSSGVALHFSHPALYRMLVEG